MQTYHHVTSVCMCVCVCVFRAVIDHTRRLDDTRPVTFAMSGASSPYTDTVVSCSNKL